MATIFERVKKVTVTQLGVADEEVTPEASFVSELGADSLDLVELIMALEEEFSTPERKVSIPDEDAEKIITVQDAVDYLRDLSVSDHEALPPKPEKPGFSRPGLPRPGFNKPGTTGGPQPGNQPRVNRPRPNRRRDRPRPQNQQRPPQTGGNTKSPPPKPAV